MISGVQRASLVVLLTILNDYFPRDPITIEFTRGIAFTGQAEDALLASLAEIIDNGLVAFRARGGPYHTGSLTPPLIAQPSSSVPLDRIPTVTTTDPTGTNVTLHTRGSSRAGMTTRSETIRNACIARDGDICRLCNIPHSLTAHIILSAHGSRNLDLWSFVAMFRGGDATASVKAAALDPDPTNPDNLMNVIQLCANCQRSFDAQRVSLVPQILEDPASVFPYDPRVVTQYDVVVEFPEGSSQAGIPAIQNNRNLRWVRPGHVITLRTADPTTHPLPHPLLLQLHVLCSRMVVMRAAAGYPVFLEDESDSDTLYDLLGASNDQSPYPAECAGQKSMVLAHPVLEVSRDPAIVMLELEQRKREREQLLQRLQARWATMWPSERA